MEYSQLKSGKIQDDTYNCEISVKAFDAVDELIE